MNQLDDITHGFDGFGGFGPNVASDFVEAESSEFEDVLCDSFCCARDWMVHVQSFCVVAFWYHRVDIERAVEAGSVSTS